jgi:hypothetical protein
MARIDKRIIGPSRKGGALAEETNRRRQVKGSRLMRCWKLSVVAAAGGLGFVPFVHADAITYETQTRVVSVKSLAEGFARGGTSMSPTTEHQSQSQSAGSFGDFNGDVSVTSTFGPGSPMATSSAQQTSSLGSTGFSASGRVSANSSLATELGPANSSGSTSFHITFDVAQAVSYTFSANLNSSVDPAAPGNTDAIIRLTGAHGVNVFTPITTVNLVDFQSQGTLAAGRYTLAMNASATSNDETDEFVNYSFSLADGPVVLQNGPSLAPVPLPAAAPMTVTTLTVLAIGGLVRRRYRGWVRTTML